MTDTFAGSALCLESLSETLEPVDQQTFRRVLSTFASGVTVVTVADGDVYHGSTVASFCSLSLDPPLVLICLDRRSTTHHAIAQVESFAVNILGSDGADLSQHFARRNPDKFAGVAWHSGYTGAPLLAAAIATLECRVVNQFPGGDHSIFIGEVLSASARNNVDPLVYFHSGYHQLA